MATEARGWGRENSILTVYLFETTNEHEYALIKKRKNNIFPIGLFVIAFLIAPFFFFFKYSKVGIAKKATQQNKTAVGINGISTNHILGLTWGLSAIVETIGGAFILGIIEKFFGY